MVVAIPSYRMICSATPKEDRFKRAASHKHGALSIFTGIAANLSMKTGQVVKVDVVLKI
jgi:hypothetical protein